MPKLKNHRRNRPGRSHVGHGPGQQQKCLTFYRQYAGKSRQNRERRNISDSRNPAFASSELESLSAGMGNIAETMAHLVAESMTEVSAEKTKIKADSTKVYAKVMGVATLG